MRPDPYLNDDAKPLFGRLIFVSLKADLLVTKPEAFWRAQVISAFPAKPASIAKLVLEEAQAPAKRLPQLDLGKVAIAGT